MVEVMSEESKKDTIKNKILEFMKEKPNDMTNSYYWIKRILAFLDIILPYDRYNPYKNSIKGFIDGQESTRFLGNGTYPYVNKVLQDLIVTIDMDSIDNFSVDFHPELKRVSLDLFRDGHYSQAIFEASKALYNYVKNKAGINNVSAVDGMARAFNEDNPIIKLNKLISTSDQDEQKGIRFIFQGAMMAIRNPKAHETIRLKDPKKALEYLAFFSLLFRRVDDGFV